jgi:hypothetical protein
MGIVSNALLRQNLGAEMTLHASLLLRKMRLLEAFAATNLGQQQSPCLNRLACLHSKQEHQNRITSLVVDARLSYRELS